MILVTGGTGFLGAYVIADLLLSGEEVRAIRRESSDMSEVNSILALKLKGREDLLQRLQWFETDLLDVIGLESAMQGTEEVYHCAGVVSFNSGDSSLLTQVNVEGTANMVNVALATGIKKFCHVSSIAALGRSRHSENIDEDSKWEDSPINSNYAISKMKGELEVWRGIEEGLNAVIVNPGVILGFGDLDKGAGKIYSRVWKGNPFYTTGVNGYVDVNDVSAAMIQLMKSPGSGKRFILVAENAGWKKILGTMARGFGKPQPNIKLPPLLVGLGWRILHLHYLISGTEPLVTRESARSAFNTFFYSSKKIEDEIGFRFMPLEDTILRSCREFIEAKK
jgi:dihydroflavonol-4-reductase